MPKAAILNALTRLLLIVVVVLALIVHSTLWLTVLVAGLVTIGLLYLFNVKGRQGFREDFQRNSPRGEFRSMTREYPEPYRAVTTIQPVTEPVRNVRAGLIGTETKKIPRTSTVRLDDVARTVTFRKR